MYNSYRKICIVKFNLRETMIKINQLERERERLEFKFSAFTLAEAILTMMILGILAATMVTTLKPSQYKEQAFNTLKKKLYVEIDNVVQTIQVECAKNMNMTTIYDNCDRTQSTTHSFGDEKAKRIQDAQMLAKYMRGTVADKNTANGNCTVFVHLASLKLKNGACLYPSSAPGISVDVNGKEGPNEIGMDRMRIRLNSQGIESDMDMAVAGLKNDGTPEPELSGIEGGD